MKKVFLILVICLCTFCAKRKPKDPKGLYSMNQVAVFLKDLYMLEAKVKQLKLKEDSTKVIFDYYEQKLFEKHNMEDSLYRESFKYYMEEINSLAKVYEIIADSLSLEEQLTGDQGPPDMRGPVEDYDGN